MHLVADSITVELSDAECFNSLFCSDVDLHSDSSEEHNSEPHPNNCHHRTGHIHNALISPNNDLPRIEGLLSNSQNLHATAGELRHYHSSVLRPPIA